MSLSLRSSRRFAVGSTCFPPAERRRRSLDARGQGSPRVQLAGLLSKPMCWPSQKVVFGPPRKLRVSPLDRSIAVVRLISCCFVGRDLGLSFGDRLRKNFPASVLQNCPTSWTALRASVVLKLIQIWKIASGNAGGGAMSLNCSAAGQG